MNEYTKFVREYFGRDVDMRVGKPGYNVATDLAASIEEHFVPRGVVVRIHRDLGMVEWQIDGLKRRTTHYATSSSAGAFETGLIPEKPIITPAEWEHIEFALLGVQCVAKDKCGEVWAHTEKPEKKTRYWDSNGKARLIPGLLDRFEDRPWDAEPIENPRYAEDFPANPRIPAEMVDAVKRLHPEVGWVASDGPAGHVWGYTEEPTVSGLAWSSEGRYTRLKALDQYFADADFRESLTRITDA